ncbi:MAG TPA: ATP-binding protein [Candidatus Omnitrophota bacterium]|nr:ATP-binding protein [Candidatus Omnitrophota bacterium]HPS20589.1 ATP-binding protein [Candidatus Omnitrophota bacterium]
MMQEDRNADITRKKKILVMAFQFRTITVVLGAIITFVIDKALLINPPGYFYPALIIWACVCTGYWIHTNAAEFKSVKATEDEHMSYFLFTAVIGGGILNSLGGCEWVGFFVYAFDLVYANILLPRGKALQVIGMYGISFTTVCLLEYWAVIPHVSPVPSGFQKYNDPGYVMTMCVVVIGFFFLLLSLETEMFARVFRDREDKLRMSRKRLESKTTQMEIIAGELTKKIAENDEMKKAAKIYIENKEKEVIRTREDMEEQIEKLKKTQRAMLFMINDLNEMRTQLKDGKDQLEEKVKKRTDQIMSITQKLNRSERLAFLGKLSGSVTHELRNPLGVIKNAVYCLERVTPSESEKYEKYLRILKKQVTIIDAIIEDIMGFAKARPPELKETDLKDLINAVIDRIVIPELVQVRKDYRDARKVFIDARQMEHAIGNLINNAIIAMKGNGILTLKVFNKDEEHVSVEVEDTGCGINTDQVQLIFEPLYSTKPKGTGLGLPLAKMIVEAQRGTITFRSTPDIGTTFEVILPAGGAVQK